MARRRSTRQALRSESRNLKGAQSKRCSCRQTGVSSCSKHWYARNMYGIKDEICAQSLSSKPRFIAASTLSSLDPLVNRLLSSHVPTPSPALQSPSASDFTTCEETSYRTNQPTSRSRLDIPSCAVLSRSRQGKVAPRESATLGLRETLAGRTDTI
jgi:hypothetical protein